MGSGVDIAPDRVVLRVSDGGRALYVFLLLVGTCALLVGIGVTASGHRDGLGFLVAGVGVPVIVLRGLASKVTCTAGEVRVRSFRTRVVPVGLVEAFVLATVPTRNAVPSYSIAALTSEGDPLLFTAWGTRDLREARSLLGSIGALTGCAVQADSVPAAWRRTRKGWRPA